MRNTERVVADVPLTSLLAINDGRGEQKFGDVRKLLCGPNVLINKK